MDWSQLMTAGSMLYYPQYLQQSPDSQTEPGGYALPPNSYDVYSNANGVTSPLGGSHPVSSSMGHQMSAMLPIPAMHQGRPQNGYGCAPEGIQGYSPQNYDTTGQVAPPGMKPRVTATLWEDEGSMCFQVEAKGVWVARRDDNHMINGTKLLNVAGMTRGRRDGILKNEKMRHVVKVGPIHLKGIWIPFERALHFANKKNITQFLYPLFLHNLGDSVYSKQQQGRLLGPSNSQPPPHHYHSMDNPVGSHVSQPAPFIASHPDVERPGLDQAHTFPIPLTSAFNTPANSAATLQQAQYALFQQTVQQQGMPRCAPISYAQGGTTNRNSTVESASAPLQPTHAPSSGANSSIKRPRQDDVGIKAIKRNRTQARMQRGRIYRI